MSYRGKSAIIAGGATGIGRALAILLAKNGARVAIADIDLDNAQSAAQEIKSAGGEAQAYHCDIVNEGQVGDVFARAFEDFGAIDYAFINAGVVQLGKLEELAASDLDWMFKVNIFGALYCARSFIREVRKAGVAGAHIVFTGSENSLTTPAHSLAVGGGGYNMTKHAMHSMVESFRFELKNEDIGVSMAVPGGVETEMLLSVQKRQDEFGGAGKPAIADMQELPEEILNGPPNISADEAAGIILKGAANKQYYIPTHAHILQEFMKRSAEIEAAFSAADL